MAAHEAGPPAIESVVTKRASVMSETLPAELKDGFEFVEQPEDRGWALVGSGQEFGYELESAFSYCSCMACGVRLA